nr:unnamed protein product [Callosobruchus chinensis]
MKDSLTRYTNDVIATCAFGIEVDSLNNPDNNFYVMGRKATDLTSLRRKLKLMGYLIIPWLYKLLKVTFLEDDVKEFFYNLVDDTIRVREEKGIVRPDMIHLMMEAKKGKASKTEGFKSTATSVAGTPSAPVKITNQDIASQVMIFFFGGFDSTSSAMCFVAHELVENPDVQSRLRDEIMETRAQYHGKLSYEALLKMKYMDMVISGRKEKKRKMASAVLITFIIC